MSFFILGRKNKKVFKQISRIYKRPLKGIPLSHCINQHCIKHYHTVFHYHTVWNTEISPNFFVWKFFGNENFSQSFGRNAKIRWRFGILRSASSGFPFFSWWNEILLCTRAFPKATLKFGKVLSANDHNWCKYQFFKTFW